MIERFLRDVEETVQCDYVRFQLADLHVLFGIFQSVMDLGNIVDSLISLRNIVASSDRYYVSC